MSKKQFQGNDEGLNDSVLPSTPPTFIPSDKGLVELVNLPIPFKTPYNAELFPQDGEINDLPSKTVPDQAMSVREILSRYARGLSLGGSRTPVFDGDDSDFPDLEKLDKVERLEVIRRVKAEYDTIQKNAMKDRADRERRAMKDLFRKEFEREANQKSTPSPLSGDGVSKNATPLL